MISEKFSALGEYGAAGMYEEPNRSLFYRKSLGLRRFYENCELAEYTGEPLYPSGVIPNEMCIHPWFLTGMDIDYGAMAAKDKNLADIFVSDFRKFNTSVPYEHAVAGNMFTHSLPNYERILSEGLLSYAGRIEKIEDTDIREGLLHLLSGIKSYLQRCICYLETVGADKALINALKKVPLYPAETIYEAVVAWNFILYLDSCDNLGCVAAGLYPYYKGEDITELLKNLYSNLDANNGFSMALGTDYNPLTLQCLEASKGKRRPMIELFVDENTPNEVWEKALEVVKTNNGQPAFYSTKVLSGLKEKFPMISDEDLKKFCGVGCTESSLAGLSNIGSIDAGINLLLILENAIYTQLEASKSFEEFYGYYINEVRVVVDNVCDKISISQIDRAKYQPLPMRTLLIDDCIDNGLDYNNGGARYKWSLVNFAGMINVIDSMLVIKSLVFDDKTFSPQNLINCLKTNNSEFLSRVKKHEICFGCNNQEADAFSNKISTDIYSMLDGKKPAMGFAFLPASIQFSSQGYAGAHIGATPDGRESGTPLCDSLGAVFGKDTEGPTALLKSVASLDLKRVLGIPVLNFNINPDFDNNLLKGLILGYMELGGIQIQITCASAEVLKEAYEKPDMHRNLIVRVGGYSEYFNCLSDDLKRMIINRSIQKSEQ